MWRHIDWVCFRRNREREVKVDVMTERQKQSVAWLFDYAA
jgi:hypothetical protein